MYSFHWSVFSFYYFRSIIYLLINIQSENQTGRRSWNYNIIAEVTTFVWRILKLFLNPCYCEEVTTSNRKIKSEEEVEIIAEGTTFVWRILNSWIHVVVRKLYNCYVSVCQVSSQSCRSSRWVVNTTVLIVFRNFIPWLNSYGI